MFGILDPSCSIPLYNLTPFGAQARESAFKADEADLIFNLTPTFKPFVASKK